MKKSYFPSRNILLLGFISLFSDISSQMVYPLLPLFLKSLGTTVLFIGLIEGIAEATAALFKTIAGRLSDLWQKRKAFVLAGYGLSNLVKPLLFWAGNWHQVLTIRFVDRLGKATRNPPRDALIAGSVDKSQRGKAFGWHLAMDRAGALLGPLLALLCSRKLKACFSTINHSWSDCYSLGILGKGKGQLQAYHKRSLQNQAVIPKSPIYDFLGGLHDFYSR